jgi:hypothetical protein
VGAACLAIRAAASPPTGESVASTVRRDDDPRGGSINFKPNSAALKAVQKQLQVLILKPEALVEAD